MLDIITYKLYNVFNNYLTTTKKRNTMITQLITFKANKKKRKFFTGKLNTKYNARLLVDSTSSELKIDREYKLVVEKLSDDKLDFKMIKSINTEDLNTETIFVDRFSNMNNTNIAKEMHKIGGQFESNAKTWRVLNEYKDEVKEIETTFRDESMVSVQITAKDDIYVTDSYSQLRFCGQLMLAFNDSCYYDDDINCELSSQQECEDFTHDDVKRLKFYGNTHMSNGQMKLCGFTYDSEFFTIAKNTTFTLTIKKNVYDKYKAEEQEKWSSSIK